MKQKVRRSIDVDDYYFRETSLNNAIDILNQIKQRIPEEARETADFSIEYGYYSECIEIYVSYMDDETDKEYEARLKKEEQDRLQAEQLELIEAEKEREKEAKEAALYLKLKAKYENPR